MKLLLRCMLQPVQRHTACGQLSEAAARLAKIMHYDPKIDYFCKKTQQQRSRRYPVFSVCTCWLVQVCAHVHIHVSGSGCTRASKPVHTGEELA